MCEKSSLSFYESSSEVFPSIPILVELKMLAWGRGLHAGPLIGQYSQP